MFKPEHHQAYIGGTMPEPTHTWTVEFFGPKGWEISTETPSIDLARDRFKKIIEEGWDARLTCERF
jgi:hypothetical protein